jgi:hypothetical protein
METLFLQINGTAMGTKMAPSYAKIFMGKLEKLIIQYEPYKQYPLLTPFFVGLLQSD